MADDEKRYREYLANELKGDDTFQFECSMCGSCCRRRAEPIVITGPDLFRIAKTLNISPLEAAQEYTDWTIGVNSHMPVLTLRERLDGSCRLLRNGRCTVHQNKPSVCALFPLGRMYNPEEKRFIYFKNTFCSSSKKGTKVKNWTLDEWLDEFRLRETEDDVRVWNRMITSLVRVTAGIDRAKIDGILLRVLFGACYFQYDTATPYAPQVEAHMELLKGVLPEMAAIPPKLRLFED